MTPFQPSPQVDQGYAMNSSIVVLLQDWLRKVPF
ncbi:hypothetical protein ACQCSU_16495 [Pseudarthrobacter sp. O4]